MTQIIDRYELLNQLTGKTKEKTSIYLNSPFEFFNVLAKLLFTLLFVLKLIWNSVDLIFELQFFLLTFLLGLQLAFFVLANVCHADLFAEVGENSKMKKSECQMASLIGSKKVKTKALRNKLWIKTYGFASFRTCSLKSFAKVGDLLYDNARNYRYYRSYLNTTMKQS